MTKQDEPAILAADRRALVEMVARRLEDAFDAAPLAAQGAASELVDLVAHRLGTKPAPKP